MRSGRVLAEEPFSDGVERVNEFDAQLVEGDLDRRVELGREDDGTDHGVTDAEPRTRDEAVLVGVLESGQVGDGGLGLSDQGPEAFVEGVRRSWFRSRARAAQATSGQLTMASRAVVSVR